jgi:creatinine amidohydrolase
VEPTSWALDELAWPEVRSAIERDPRIILPVGALEQHGPHLPLGTNTRIAARVSREVSQRLGILRAPAFAYGTTNGADPYAGAAGLRRKTLHRSVNELLGQWENDGIREFLIISAHRYEPHLEALLMALTSKAVSSIYDLYQVDISDLLDGNPQHEHAGELETSLMLHLAPELVHRDRMRDFVPVGQALRKYTRRRAPTPPMESGGTLGAPSRATAAKGAAIFERYVAALCATVSRSRSNRTSTAG